MCVLTCVFINSKTWLNAIVTIAFCHITARWVEVCVEYFKCLGLRLRCDGDEISSSTHTQSRARPFDIIGSLKCSTVSALIICASSEAHPFFTSEAGGSHTLQAIQHNVCECAESRIQETSSLTSIMHTAKCCYTSSVEWKATIQLCELRIPFCVLPTRSWLVYICRRRQTSNHNK